MSRRSKWSLWSYCSLYNPSSGFCCPSPQEGRHRPSGPRLSLPHPCLLPLPTLELGSPLQEPIPELAEQLAVYQRSGDGHSYPNPCLLIITTLLVPNLRKSSPPVHHFLQVLSLYNCLSARGSSQYSFADLGSFLPSPQNAAVMLSASGQLLQHCFFAAWSGWIFLGSFLEVICVNI